MTGLDTVDDSVLTKLLGTGELQMMCCGAYDIGFFFQEVFRARRSSSGVILPPDARPGLKINIGSSCHVRTPDGDTTTWEPERNVGDMRMFSPMLKAAIKSYRITPNHELILTFTNGYELILIEHGGFESFLIIFPDGGQLPI
jgi:hypothetical protein